MFQFDRWLFAIKLFTSAMIAFALSVRLGLPQNYWPVVTCCVLANPLTAGVRSKVVYRFFGTLCAGLMSLILAALFGSAPVLMVVGAGLCGTVAFTIGLLDRTPRSYGFLLFGLTLMIVLVAGIDHPERMFDTALARVTEISLGVVCATVVDSLIVPRSLAPVIRARLRASLPDMERWMDDALERRKESPQGAHDRLKVIADMTALSALAGQLRYDPMVSTRNRQLIFAIQRRMLRLVPLISAVESRIAAFDTTEHASIVPQMQYAWNAVRATPAGIETASVVLALPDSEAATPWQAMVRQNAVELIEQVLRFWDEVRLLNGALEGQTPLPGDLRARLSDDVPFPLRSDFHVALRVGAGILLAYTALASLWLLTGWGQGAGAVLIGVVALAFFGGVDQADKLIAQFARFSVVAIMLGVVLSYWLLPLAQDFISFVVVMGLFMLPLAAWGATNPLAILLLAMVLSTINLQGTYSPLDFGVYLDASVASLIGIFIAFYSITLVRRMGSSHALARFAADDQADVVKMTQRADRSERDAYLDRALDRIGVMTARLAAAGEAEQSTRLLKRLRAGANIADLRRATDTTDGEVRAAAESLLATLREEIGQEVPPPSLLENIDRTLSVAERSGTLALHPLVRSLIGLRLALFEQSPAWQPAA